MDGDTAVLQDLKSTNGTFITNKPVSRHVLEHGD
jgi:pSer/pThr/pTyr-binding forkhead associated (FHA) protein